LNRLILFVLLFSFVFNSVGFSGQMYTATDENGNLIMSDQPITEEQKREAEKKQKQSQEKPTLILERSEPKPKPQETISKLVAIEKNEVENPFPPDRKVVIASDSNNGLALLECAYQVGKSRIGMPEYLITIRVQNNFTKGIKLIQGGVVFKDLLGADLFRIGIDPDLRIEAGKEIIDKGVYSVGFMVKDQRMLKMSPTDVFAEMKLRKIVFFDNSIQDFK